MRNKIIALALGVALGTSVSVARTFNLEMGNVTYSMADTDAGRMTVTDGTTLTINGVDLATSSITRMYTDNRTVTPSTVQVTYDGTQAHVNLAGNLLGLVTATVDGTYVTLTQSDQVSATTCGEVTYTLSGESSDGCFTLVGSFKATIELQGLTLTNTKGAPIDIQNGKRIAMSAKKGTVNTLTDCASGSQKGCINCKGHLELKGAGTLNVIGNTSHAIYAKEYVEVKKLTLNVTKAVKDGINCNQYFKIESGTVTISGVEDDGIQVSFKDDTDREAEDSGMAYINGGALNISVTGAATKGLKTDGGVNVTDGEITISATGTGVWDSTKLKTKAAACIGTDGNVEISGGKFNLTATGGGGKGINADGTLTITGGEFDIKTSGGVFAYVNGTTYDNYTGNTDRLDSDYKSSAKGMKIDGDVLITGGTINVTTTGNNAEGIESKSTLTIEGGTITIHAKDDAINSSSHMYIKGGDITVIATGNDGLDSNGNLYIMGGTIRAFGAAAPECGIDANEEEGYTVIITGGTLLAVGGGSNSEPSTAESTQAYVTLSASVTAGQEVSILSGTTTLATFTVPTEYTGTSGGGNRPGGGPGGGNRPGSSGGGTLITCPGLVSGSSYTVKVGTTTQTATAKLKGSSSRP